MEIFLSYPSEERALAEEIQLALRGAGHGVFIDSDALHASADYHAGIRTAIERSDVFVFLITPAALQHGRYTLSELACARERWPHPAGHVVPVLARPTPMADVPPYLKSVTILEPQGNPAADVLAAVARLKTPWRAWKKAALAGAGALAVAVAIGAALLLKHPPGPGKADEIDAAQLPNPLQLRFDYALPPGAAASAADERLRVNVQVNRRIFDGEQLVPQDSGWYSYNTAFPDPDATLSGSLVRQLRFDAAPL